MALVNQVLNIQYPIIQGGMGNISSAELAAAVSEAGGLGTIGCGTMDPETVENLIVQTKELTSKPFAVNIPINVTPYTEKLVQLVIDHGVPVVSLSAGNPQSILPHLSAAGITVIAIVSSVKHAKKAEAAGADILVAEGFEAAGINSPLELTTFTLIPQVVRQVQAPVVAAGGIGDGKGLAAALALGAQGVQIGTRLIATQEAPFHDEYKQTLLNADGTDTLVIGRTFNRPRRVLATPYAHHLDAHEHRGMTAEAYSEKTSEAFHIKGALEGDGENGFMNGGQIAGLIDSLPTVQSLLKEMVEEAETQFRTLSVNFSKSITPAPGKTF
ncbi:Enoyl-[acyl-carrier-protein] reductase (NADH) [Lentibacillus sp. JNUCC-1]|uniref:NAD(P)H-dependent flavin oxidoreductase n=1 Tax=Lentibacillus sp. JNUCC-1 TaxID=2654513 RepID=UPI0012E8C452|nr:nitronate monooxygenase [Lentibacillus sp. JNUCC-1]MUV37539.1 Enoyl-[acyl-carrier-protein] reductase (NADH) [Lentibacillus sp. JNUCC-1]